MKIGIVMSTFYRKDGKSAFFLKRSIDSVIKQKHENWKLFLIGDRYERPEEIEDILSLYKKYDIYFNNLPIAKERDNPAYWNRSFGGNMPVWCAGGVNAINTGIVKAKEEGFSYICHLDHDDHWHPDHLMLINKCIKKYKSLWISTKSTYGHSAILPSGDFGSELFIDRMPQPANTIHSSCCIDFSVFPYLYEDTFEKTGTPLPADLVMINRINEYISKNNNFTSKLINKITCFKEEEGYIRDAHCEEPRAKI
jgi:glycosyltransferase involved in cell wall biosynthesis